jgi:hypothetical protein
MKKFLISLALFAAPLLAVAGISITIGEPDYYGVINIGNMRPQLLYPEPIIIQRGSANYAPLYLRVPPGHAKHWSKHCAEYNACGRQVYFVSDSWYQNDFAPQYREKHGNRGQGKGKGHWKNRDNYDEGPGRHHEGRGHNKHH